MAVSVVVRHTFLQLEAAPAGRPRAFSDTMLYELQDSDGFQLDLDNAEKRSESSADSTLAESSNELWSESSDCGEESPKASSSEPVAQAAMLWTPMIVMPCTQPVPAASQSTPRTTLMLRNLPSSFGRADLLELIDSIGFEGQYDFLYLPVDFQSAACLGYAFVNMLESAAAEQLTKKLQGFCSWSSDSSKVLEVCWSEPTQGIEMLVERFRNSRVMHGMVPDEYKPAVFKNGVLAPFPKNTQRIRPPYSGSKQRKCSRL